MATFNMRAYFISEAAYQAEVEEVNRQLERYRSLADAKAVVRRVLPEVLRLLEQWEEEDQLALLAARYEQFNQALVKQDKAQMVARVAVYTPGFLK